VTDDEAKAEYYQSSYSQQLQDSIAANLDDPFSDAYYTSIIMLILGQIFYIPVLSKAIGA
jgi:hypothetical protein